MALPTTTTTISALVAATNPAKTMRIAVDATNQQTGQTETLKLTLEQIYGLIREIGNEPPTGVFYPWPTDSIPLGFLEANGQHFDTTLYVELAKIWPSGILPDVRGRVLKAVKAGKHAGQTEEDQLKSHRHNVTIDSKNVGTKTTGSHSHTHGRGTMDIRGHLPATVAFGIDPDGVFVKGNVINGAGGIGSNGNLFSFQASRAWSGRTSSESHTHQVAIGSHNHTGRTASFGASENLVKGMYVRFIVRAK